MTEQKNQSLTKRIAKIRTEDRELYDALLSIGEGMYEQKVVDAFAKKHNLRKITIEEQL